MPAHKITLLINNGKVHFHCSCKKVLDILEPGIIKIEDIQRILEQYKKLHKE